MLEVVGQQNHTCAL